MSKSNVFFLAVLALLIPIALYGGDRSLANWAQHEWPKAGWAGPLHKLPEAAWVSAACALGLMGLAACLGWHPAHWARSLMVVAVAVLVAIALREQLRWLVWPEMFDAYRPEWMRERMSALVKMRDAKEWASFPSAPMAVTAAVFAILWARAAQMKILWVLLLGAVMVGLVLGGDHYISDCLAGLLLGWLVGTGMLALFDRN